MEIIGRNQRTVMELDKSVDEPIPRFKFGNPVLSVVKGLESRLLVQTSGAVDLK